MFNKTADYLYGELTATLDDYRLLENMNQSTITKYSEMKHIAGNVGKSMADLKDKCRCFYFVSFEFSTIKFFLDDTLQPFLNQIDQIEDSVIKLEQAAYKLDAYSKRLEAKFKNLEKR